MQLFDASKNPVRYLGISLGSFTVQTGEAYVAFNLESPVTPGYSDIQLEVGSVATPYQDFIRVSKSSVEGLPAAIENAQVAKESADDTAEKIGAFRITPKISDNLLDPATIIPKALVNDAGGGLIYTGVAPSYDTFDYAPVEGSTLYSGITNTGASQSFRKLAFYNADKAFLSGGDTLTSFTTPSNARFVRVSVANTASTYNPANIGLFKGISPVWKPYGGRYDVKLTDNSTPTDEKASDNVASIADVKNLIGNSGASSKGFAYNLTGATLALFTDGSYQLGVKNSRGTTVTICLIFRRIILRGRLLVTATT